MFRLREWIIDIDRGDHPEELMIEVTTRCNYDCIHCFRRRMMGESLGDMDPVLYKRIIDDAASSGVTRITFSGWGEPLIHPDILDMLRYAKKKGMRVLLNTNGYFLRDYLDEIYDLGVDELVVSIDAPTSDLYALIRKGGDLGRLVEALLRLRDMRRRDHRRKPELKIQFTVNKYNYKSIIPMVELAGKLAATELRVSNIVALTPEAESLACYNSRECVEEMEKIMYRIAVLSMEHNVVVSMPNFSLKTERECPFTRAKAMFVRRDGLVAPCIYYAHTWSNSFYGVERTINAVVFGDLKRERIMDIWMKPEYVRFRYNTYMMHYPSCPDCPLRDYCVFTKNNDIDCWGNQPTCAHCPYSRDMVRCPLQG